MLDLDSDVIGEPGPLCMERFDNLGGMAGTVEKVGIAERNVLGAGSDLAPDVFQHHLRLHDSENAAIHRDYRAVPAPMLAAAAGFRIAGAPGASIHHHTRISCEVGQARSIRRLKLLPGQRNHWSETRLSSASRQPPYQVQQRLFELTG